MSGPGGLESGGAGRRHAGFDLNEARANLARSDAGGSPHDPARLERERAFGERVELALRRSRKVGADDAGEGDAPALRVLAVAQASPFPLPASAEVAAPSSGPDLAGLVADIQTRLADTLRAEAMTGAAGSARLQIDLAGAVPGLHSVAVTMTADSIEVVFARVAGAASPELVAAAQALAERLSLRFGRRVVTVAETDAPSDKPEQEPS